MADWSVLGESSDPIPGSPEEVAALGRQLRETADMIRRQTASIRNLTSGDGWDSEAGKKFKGTAGDTADKLSKAYDRYDAAATALGEYADYGNPERNWASALQHAQDEARKLLTRAEQAHADSQSAGTAIDQLPQHDPSSQVQAQQLNAKKQAADQDLQGYRKQLDGIKSFRDEHAHRAAAAIGNVIGHDGVHDSFWDKFSDVLKVVSHIAGVVAAVAGALSLVLGWVPFLGQALVLIAAVASVVAFACDLILAIGGQGNWLDVGLDLIGCLSFGAGRLLGDGVKAASLAARGEAATRDATAFMEMGVEDGEAWDLASEFSGGLKGGDALEAAVSGPSSWVPKLNSLDKFENLVNPFKGTVDGFKEAGASLDGVHSAQDFLKLARLGDPAVTDAANAARGVAEGASGFRSQALIGSHVWTGSQVGAVGLGWGNLEKPDSGLLPGEQYLPEPNVFRESPFGDLKHWADTGSG